MVLDPSDGCLDRLSATCEPMWNHGQRCSELPGSQLGAHGTGGRALVQEGRHDAEQVGFIPSSRLTLGLDAEFQRALLLEQVEGDPP
jgi:hypothetical protein